MAGFWRTAGLLIEFIVNKLFGMHRIAAKVNVVTIMSSMFLAQASIQ